MKTLSSSLPPLFAFVQSSRRRVAEFLALLYLMAVPISSGTHADWQWDFPIFYCIAVSAKHGLTVGKDFFDVVGPLGYLYKPVALEEVNHYVIYLFFTALMHVLFLFALFAHARRTSGYLGVILILLIQITFMSWTTFFDLIFVTVTIPYLFEDIQRKKSFFFIIPAVLSGLTLFVKFNHGFVLSIVYVFYVLFSHFIKNESWRLTAIKFGVYGTTVALFGALFFRSAGTLLNYLTTTAEMASAYAIQKGIPDHPSEVVLAVMVLSFLFFVGAEIGRRRSWTMALFWIAVSGCVAFFNFKHAFVGQRIYVNHFITFAPFVIATSLFFASSRRIWLILISTIFTVWLISSFHLPESKPWHNWTELSPKLINSLLSWKQTNRAAAAENMKFISEGCGHQFYDGNPLSESTIKMIGDKSVYAFRHHLPFINFSGLKMRPNPFITLGPSLTARLERKNAEYIAGPNSADYFLLSWEGYEYTHPTFLCPASFLAIISNYEFAAEEKNLLILKKKPKSALPPVKKYLLTIEAEWDTPVTIPDSNHLVVAEIHEKLSLKGRIFSILFRVPPMLIGFRTGKNETYMSRYVPGLGSNGLMVNYLPHGLPSIKSLVEKGEIYPEAQKYETFVLTGGENCFKKNFRVNFYELAFKKTNLPVESRSTSTILSGEKNNATQRP